MKMIAVAQDSKWRLLYKLARFASLIFLLFVIFPHPSFAQEPSKQAIPNEYVSRIINKAEDFLKMGQRYFEAGNYKKARNAFDKAVDVILESGIDVRKNARIQDYYLGLIEQIYNIERNQSRSGDLSLVERKPSRDDALKNNSKPSPLDELANLVLTPEEQNVIPEVFNNLNVAKDSINFTFNINPLIQQYINYYQSRGHSTMESGLLRSGQFTRMARKIFREEGVPEDLVWIAQVSSDWQTSYYSPERTTSGLWQITASTGASFGLRQTQWVDERNSYEKATRASARYLKFLANRYNSNWELAIAAYNTGEGNIDRAISRAGSTNFWTIYPYIAQETRNYVPNILATILIAKNPEKYGFNIIRPDAPLSYDVVQVPSAISLQLIADATDTSVDYLRMLNPELRRDITPRGESYHVRVPAGRAKQFVAVLKRVPVEDRESARLMTIFPGEDLEAFAERTGYRIEQLDVMQGEILSTESTGTKVVVRKNENYENPLNAPLLFETVKVPGSTSLQLIARATGSTLDNLRSLNPELKLDSTPDGVEYQMRVPAGTSNKLAAILNQIPSELRKAMHPRTLVARAAIKQKAINYPIDISLSVNQTSQQKLSAKDITQRASSSIVLLEMYNARQQPLTQGSGFFVKPNIIATSAHLIKDADIIYVKTVQQEKVYIVESVIGFNEKKDLALLKVSGANVNPLMLGDSQQMIVGDEIFMLCNQQESVKVISPGIITDINKDDTGGLFKFTAPMQLGGIGGPVINRQGQVIGIITFFTGEQNFNFAVPSAWLLELGK